jgi:HSP20 family protein
MKLVRFNPNRIQRQVARRNYDNFIHPFFAEREKSRNFNPSVDVNEMNDKILLSVELPGIKSDALSISVDSDRIMTIRGEKKSLHNTENEKLWRKEISYGEFERKFTLTDEIDTNSIDAKFENGLLELTLKKIQQQKPQEINVEIN